MTHEKATPLSKQEKKSLDMRRRICEATISALADIGYERVSTKIIAERGEMSRGAVNYHFPTKNDILVAAYEHVLGEWGRLWPFTDQPHGAPLNTDALIDALWSELFSTSTYLAILELMLAARLDQNLGVRLRAALASWSVERDHKTIQIIGLDTNDEEALKLLRLNLCMLRGISVNQFFAEGLYSEDSLISVWKEVFAREIKSHLKN